jgi:hypothetical protein
MYKYPKEKTTIEVKFLPNFDFIKDKIGEYSVELIVGINESSRTSTVYFSHVYMNGEINILKYGVQIKKLLNSFVNGCYLNSEGLYLSASDNSKIHDEDEDEYSLTEYYLTKDGDVVLPFETFNYKVDELEHKTDVVYQERFNPYDIASKYYLQFDIDWVMDGKYLKYENFKLVERKPLWSEGDDKDKVKSMFKDTTTIKECIKTYKEESIIKYPNTLFDEDALKERGKIFQKEAIVRKEQELAEMKERYNNNYNIS